MQGRVTEMSVTVKSTTGTQPLTFTRISPDKVQIRNEFGAAQDYYVQDIINAIADQGA